MRRVVSKRHDHPGKWAFLFTFALVVVTHLVLTSTMSSAEELQTPAQTERWAMKVYFIYFCARTYQPVTTARIERTARHAIWFAKDHKFADTLLRRFARSSKPLDLAKNFIRMKVEFPSEDRTWYVDADGRGVSNDGKYIELSKEERDELTRKIVSFSGVIDMHVHERVLHRHKGF